LLALVSPFSVLDTETILYITNPLLQHIETPFYLSAALMSKVEEIKSPAKSYLEQVFEKDKGQSRDNIYLLAKRHIASGLPTDAARTRTKPPPDCHGP
jgi:hypothetical protein